MRIILITLLSIPFLAFGQNKDSAECLIALSKVDLPKNSPPVKISPEAGFQWQWDGKEISLLKSPYKKTTQAEVAWSLEKYKENGDGRVAMKSFYDRELPKKNFEDLQNSFLRLSFLSLLRTEPTAQNAVELDKIYAECEGIHGLTPAKASLGTKPIVTNKSIGELSRINREKIHAQFPQIFKTPSTASTNNSGTK